MEGQPINKDTYMDVSEEARDRLRAHGITDRDQQDAWFQRSGELLADALETDDRRNAEEELALRGAGARPSSESLD